MSRLIRRQTCRRHPLAVAWISFLTCMTILMLYECYQDEITIVQFEVKKCPACYGTSLCTQVYSGEFKLVGWSKWKVLQLFNPKKVFYAEYKGRPVVIKKLAHDKERDIFDQALCAKAYHVENGNCDVGAAILYLADEVGLQNVRLLPLSEGSDIQQCPTARLYDKIELVKSTNLSSEIANLITLMQLNPEPIILQIFKYEDGWPFPRYFGACGRTVVEEYIGPTLYDERNSFWKVRLKYAYQIAVLASKFTDNSEDFALYLTDATYDNFAVSSEGQVILIDVESIIIVDKKIQRQKNNDTSTLMLDRHANHEDISKGHLTYSPSDLCSHAQCDHNYYVVCQGLLSQNPWSPGMPGGLLHDLPEDFDQKWNLTNLINECRKPSTYDGRFQVFPKLLTALKEAVIDSS